MNDKKCSFHPYRSRNYKGFKSSVRNWGQRLKIYFLLYNNIIPGHYLQLLYSNPLLQTLRSPSVFPACPTQGYPWGGKREYSTEVGLGVLVGIRVQIRNLPHACGVSRLEPGLLVRRGEAAKYLMTFCLFVCKSFMYLKVYTCFSTYSADISVGMSKTREDTHLGRANGHISDPKQVELQQGCKLLPGLLRI